MLLVVVLQEKLMLLAEDLLEKLMRYLEILAVLQ